MTFYKRYVCYKKQIKQIKNLKIKRIMENKTQNLLTFLEKAEGSGKILAQMS